MPQQVQVSLVASQRANERAAGLESPTKEAVSPQKMLELNFFCRANRLLVDCVDYEEQPQGVDDKEDVVGRLWPRKRSALVYFV